MDEIYRHQITPFNGDFWSEKNKYLTDTPLPFLFLAASARALNCSASFVASSESFSSRGPAHIIIRSQKVVENCVKRENTIGVHTKGFQTLSLPFPCTWSILHDFLVNDLLMKYYFIASIAIKNSLTLLSKLHPHQLQSILNPFPLSEECPPLFRLACTSGPHPLPVLR